MSTRQVKEKFEWKNILLYVAYLIIIAFFLLPILWTLSLSLKEAADVFVYPPRFVSKPIAWENYINVLLQSDILLYLYNSLKIVVFVVLGTLVISSMGAFAFSRFEFFGKKLAFLSLMVFQMIPGLVVMIPLYRYFHNLGLLDTHLAVIMAMIAINISFSTWVLKGFFDSIPKELDEAALLDGCNNFQIFYKIILPISTPAISAVSILICIMAWADFTTPFLLLQSSSLFPISVGVFTFQTSHTEISIHLIAAASIIALLPAVVIFLVLQRFIVQFLIAGIGKG